MPRFFRITTGGEVTFLGNMDHVAKGLAIAKDPLTTVPALPFLMLLVLGALLSLIGRARIVVGNRSVAG